VQISLIFTDTQRKSFKCLLVKEKKEPLNAFLLSQKRILQRRDCSKEEMKSEE